MLVAVTLICTVPLFNALIIDTQLQQEINTGDPADRNVQVFINSFVSASARKDAQSRVPLLAQQYLGGFTTSAPTSFAVSDALILGSAGSNTFDPVKAPEATLQEWDL